MLVSILKEVTFLRRTDRSNKPIERIVELQHSVARVDGHSIGGDSVEGAQCTAVPSNNDDVL